MKVYWDADRLNHNEPGHELGWHGRLIFEPDTPQDCIVLKDFYEFAARVLKAETPGK